MVEISVRTSSRNDFINIDRQVQQVVADSGVKNGICTIFVPHTTAAITINENADPNVRRDIMAKLDDVIPWRDSYHHTEGNAAAHIKASLIGSSEVVIIENGRLQLGTWQSIFFCEFDGPGSRRIWITIVKNESNI